MNSQTCGHLYKTKPVNIPAQSRERAHGSPLQTEEPGTINGFWRRQSVLFFFKGLAHSWQFSNGATHTNTYTGLGKFLKKEDVELGGVKKLRADLGEVIGRSEYDQNILYVYTTFSTN